MKQRSSGCVIFELATLEVYNNKSLDDEAVPENLKEYLIAVSDILFSEIK